MPMDANGMWTSDTPPPGSTFNPGTLGSNSGGMTLDQVNQAMRQSPVYLQWMQTHGKSVDGHVSMSSSDEAGLAKTLENNGFPLPDGWHIDAGGNIAADHHIGRNVLIGVGIAAAAFGIPAIIGALGPSAAASVGAGAAAGDAGAATTVGLASGAGIGGAVAAGTGDLAALGGAGAAGAFDAAGNFLGDSTLDGTALGPAGDSIGAVGSSGGAGSSTLGKVSSLLGAAGKGVGAAATASGNNALTANQQNINGQTAFETELLNRAKEEDSQRKTDLKNEYMASAAHNPSIGPLDKSGGPQYTPAYLASLDSVAAQGSADLAKNPQYSTPNMPALPPYTPFQPGTLSKVGNILSPTLSIADAVAQYYGK